MIIHWQCIAYEDDNDNYDRWNYYVHKKTTGNLLQGWNSRRYKTLTKNK